MVSKAALRSRRMRMLMEPESEDNSRSFVTLIRADSVLCRNQTEVIGVKVGFYLSGNNSLQYF